MAVTDKATLKNWFIRKAKPLASQFASVFDSFWHKDEFIPISRVENISIILGNKVDQEVFNNHNHAGLTVSAAVNLEANVLSPYTPAVGTDLYAIKMQASGLVEIFTGELGTELLVDNANGDNTYNSIIIVNFINTPLFIKSGVNQQIIPIIFKY